MHFEEFAFGNSPVHTADPRVKLLVAVAFSILVAVSDAYRALVPALFMAGGLVLLARTDIGMLGRRLLVVNGFLVLLWLILPFTFPGESLFTLGPLVASREGAVYCLTITLRTNTIVLATIGLVGTTSIFNLVHALRHMHVPDKLVHIFFFCYRYIAVIHLEYLRLRNAMRVRCFHPKTSLHTYRSYAYLVGMLLIKSYGRSHRIYQAMLCRGFRGKYPTFHHFHLKKRDLGFLGVSAAVIAALAALQLLGDGA
ncbi:MAG: cobalt ECF transporter T component CbiQ [Candidatus Latescibacterota bacterium]